MLKNTFDRLKRRFESVYFSTVWILVVVPILSILFITASGESPLYTSISRLGWVLDRRVFMIVWSLTVLAPMLFMTNKVITGSPLADRAKRSLHLIAVINIIVSFVAGVIVPAKSGAGEVSFFGVMHDLLTSVGWLSYGVVLTAFAFCLFRKDRLEATVATCFMAFVWVTGTFFIKYVVDETSYCGASAVTQVYIINMFNIFLLIIDIYQSLLKKISDDNLE